jgi:hypothetical protein
MSGLILWFKETASGETNFLARFFRFFFSIVLEPVPITFSGGASECEGAVFIPIMGTNKNKKVKKN